MTCTSKIVVFDLDETLGYFMELGMFWDALKSYINKENLDIKIDQNFFNKVTNLYPEFLRPNIINILNYLKNKKQANKCDKLMIYTNNQGPYEWAHYLMNYFETKINFKLFDQLIAAFKVNGKQVELCRTTHMKTEKDFIRCTKVSETTEICFLDDVFYPGMTSKNIYYINIKPYIYDLPFNTMIQRLIDSNIMKLEPESFKIYILKYLSRYNYNHVTKTKESLDVDKVLSKKIMQHLHIFFNRNNVKAKNLKTASKRSILNKTIKNK